MRTEEEQERMKWEGKERKGKGSRGSGGFTVLMRNIVFHGKYFFAGGNSFLSALVCPSDSEKNGIMRGLAFGVVSGPFHHCGP